MSFPGAYNGKCSFLQFYKKSELRKTDILEKTSGSKENVTANEILILKAKLFLISLVIQNKTRSFESNNKGS